MPRSTPSPAASPAPTQAPTATHAPSATPPPTGAPTPTQIPTSTAFPSLTPLPSASPTPRPPTATPKPTRPSGEVLQDSGISIKTEYGIGSGIQFKRVDARGIGNAEVLALHVLDAVDVWGYADQHYELCFPQTGELVFLDAAQSPRRPQPLRAVWKDGKTCAVPGRAGTVALVQSGGGGGVRITPAPTPRPMQPLHNCQVVTNYMLNFRDSPGGEYILKVIPWQTQLTALTRTDGWIMVQFEGLQGWVSAPHVRMKGGC